MPTASYGVGRLAASQGDVYSVPYGYPGDLSKRLVVYCHGAGGKAVNSLSIAAGQNGLNLIQTVANRFPMISGDWGTVGQGGTSDSDNWGNTNAQSLIDAAIPIGKGALGTKPGRVILLGGSMGVVTALNYARANPSKVAAVCGFLSAVDIDDVRDNNRGTLRASVSNAWGTGSWTAPGTPALPAGANPALNARDFWYIPMRLFYSTGDTVAVPSAVTAFCTAANQPNAAVAAGSLDHSDASTGNVPLDNLLTFLEHHR